MNNMTNIHPIKLIKKLEIHDINCKTFYVSYSIFSIHYQLNIKNCTFKI